MGLQFLVIFPSSLMAEIWMVVLPLFEAVTIVFIGIFLKKELPKL
jgi:hypothetical protein